jgi:hypothetical protein
MNKIIPLAPKSKHLSQLSLEEKLVSTLIRLRHAATFDLVAFIMKSHKSTIKRAWADTIPLLYQALNPSIHMHHGEPVSFMNSTFRYVVDGFEHRISTSTDKVLEKLSFSVKKKQHSFTQLIYTSMDGRICHISSTY